jgi:hypothetical protein
VPDPCQVDRSSREDVAGSRGESRGVSAARLLAARMASARSPGSVGVGIAGSLATATTTGLDDDDQPEPRGTIIRRRGTPEGAGTRYGRKRPTLGAIAVLFATRGPVAASRRRDRGGSGTVPKAELALLRCEISGRAELGPGQASRSLGPVR